MDEEFRNDSEMQDWTKLRHARKIKMTKQSAERQKHIDDFRKSPIPGMTEANLLHSLGGNPLSEREIEKDASDYAWGKVKEQRKLENGKLLRPKRRNRDNERTMEEE